MTHKSVESANALHALIHTFMSSHELYELLQTYEARLALEPSRELLNQVAILRCIERLRRIQLQEHVELDEFWR